MVFAYMGVWASAFMDGKGKADESVIMNEEDYPCLTKICKTVGNHQKVKAFYGRELAKKGEDNSTEMRKNMCKALGVTPVAPTARRTGRRGAGDKGAGGRGRRRG